jgi:dTDP-4-dehydrorhamnose 3,5-epimerase
MKSRKTRLDEVLIVEPDVFEDGRGFFMEAYHKAKYVELGIDVDWAQDNLAFSRQGVLRGLHLQHPQEQAKLVQVLQGEVFDVAVDVRRGSPNFGRWTCEILSATNKLQMFVPEGFAHGYCVLSETALFHYKCSRLYAPQHEMGVLWSDPELGIDWPVKHPAVSEKDGKLPRLSEIDADRLPNYESMQRKV